MSGKFALESIVILLLLISILPEVSADSSSSTKDYVQRVNDLDFPVMYSSYPELKNIQSQTVSSLQGRLIDEETRTYVETVIKIISTFNEMLSLSDEDNLESHETAITKAESLRSDIESLEAYREPREKYYPLFSRISLKNFFKKEAEYFADKAKNERNTNLRIKYLLNEARIYKDIGDPKYAEISYRAEEEKAAYDYDIRLIEDAIQESNVFFSYADGNVNKEFFSSIELFGKSFKLEESITDANQLSAYHEEEKLKTEGELLLEKIRTIKRDAGASVIQFVLIICTVYLLVSLYFSFSITRWKKEVENVDLGNDLLGGLALE